MSIWSIIIVTSIVFYLTLLLILIWGILHVKIANTFKINSKYNFSIIVPFRNEAHNLPDLLHSLIHLEYPKEMYEIILVNDASTDVFGKIIEIFRLQNPETNIRLIDNQRHSGSPKKDAIHTAVQVAAFDWLITTDADCMLNREILSELNAFIAQHQPIFIAGLVKMKAEVSMLQQFQKWDWNSLLGFTLAGFGLKNPFICSGAYLCYAKDAFIKINGFSGNEHIASGDDVFLMQKMYDYQPEKVLYLFQPNVVVHTKPLESWGALIEQRKRWMSKTGSIQNNFLKYTGIVIWWTNFAFIISILLAFVNFISWRLFFSFIIVKCSIDLIYLLIINRKIEEKTNYYSLIISSLIYPFFSIGVTILWFFKGFRWKERSFR